MVAGAWRRALVLAAVPAAAGIDIVKAGQVVFGNAKIEFFFAFGDFFDCYKVVGRYFFIFRVEGDYFLNFIYRDFDYLLLSIHIV